MKRDSFEAFAREWGEVFRDLLGEADPDADRYLFRLCGLIRGVPLAELPRFSKPGFDRDGLKSGGAWGQGLLMVVELQLAPNVEVKAHNHVGGAVEELPRAGNTGGALVPGSHEPPQQGARQHPLVPGG